MERSTLEEDLSFASPIRTICNVLFFANGEIADVRFTTESRTGDRISSPSPLPPTALISYHVLFARIWQTSHLPTLVTLIGTNIL